MGGPQGVGTNLKRF